MTEDMTNEQGSQEGSLQERATDALPGGDQAPTADEPGAAAPEHPRKWVPNRSKHRAKSKKSFDEKKMENLALAEERIYKGELDDNRRDPNRQPRSVSRSEERVRRKAEELAENDPVVASMRSATSQFTDFRAQYERCKASPGRLGALYATQQVRRRNAFAQEVIESTIDRSRLSAQDRAFATLLTLGVVSTSGSLDAVINRCLADPRDIKPDVRDALRISTYEVIYLRKSPHAAVDQGVELVRAVAPSAAGLGNAVLHRILKCADTFPFGDPNTNLQALALSCAFPEWLAHMLIEDMGAAAAAELMSCSNEQAPLFVHVNAIRDAQQEVFDVFDAVGSPLVPAEAGGIAPLNCYRVPNTRALTDGRVRHLFEQGKILVSDAAAQAVAHIVAEQASGSVLEVGAGRGTKTIMIQSDALALHGEQLDLTSMDSHSFKADLLEKRASEYGVKLAGIIAGNATRLDAVMPDRMFDTVFIDAPCSGLGTLRRHHEIRWRLTAEHVQELADTGLDLLRSAAGHVNPGGCIIYATCTVTYAENNGVVKRFLESEEGSAFKLAPIGGKACFSSKMEKSSPDAHFAVKFVRN